jgi:hypothetical protein
MKPSWRTPRARGRAGIASVAAGLSCLALAAPAAAISGSAGDVDASAAQYVSPSQGTVTPAGDQAPAPGSAPSQGQAVPLGEQTPVNDTAPEAQAVLPATPIAADDEGLPFTGYVLLGVLGAGLLALLLGLLIRRFTDWRLA